MSALVLIILTVLTFLLYGVMGQDKSLLLGPVFVVGLFAVAAALLRGAAEAFQRKEAGGGAVKLPVSSSLWILFFLWGAAMVPEALMTFEAKIRMLFFATVIGSFMVWGREFTAFKDSRIMLGGLIFMVMLLALYGMIIHFKSPMSILWTERYTDHYLTSSKRLASTYICPNHFAHLMQMLLPFCLALLFIPQSGIYLKILAAYSFVAMLPPLFLTESRAGWLGSIAGVGVVLCLMALRKSKKLFAGLVVLVPLCSVLLLVGAWRYSETFQRRMEPVVEFLEGQASGGIGSDSPDFRPQTWMDTLDMISANPMTGYGPGSYRYAYPEFRKRFKGKRILTGHPHNEYLELASEFGLIGFALFALAWLWGGIWVLVKSLRAEETRHAFMGFAFLGAVAGTMVHSFFDFQMHVFPNAMILALLAALAIGPIAGSDRRSKKAHRRRKKRAEHSAADDGAETGIEASEKRRVRPDWLCGVFQGALALGFVVLAIAAVPVMGSAFFNASGAQKVEGKIPQMQSPGQTEAYYQLAVKLSPDNWRAYRGLGRIVHERRRHCLVPEEKTALAQQEKMWFEKAVQFNPKDPESLVALGRTLTFLSRYRGVGMPHSRPPDTELESKGLSLIQEACNYRKFNDEYWWILGVELRRAGKYDAALDAFRYMETVRRTRSSRTNIQWLEKRLRNGDEPAPDPRPVDSVKKIDVQSVIEQFSTAPGNTQKDQSLDDLFELMEQ
ncbi:O-antigen ligase family protein [Pontiella agarivorans]|uniref:O-antigen ligase family protein n=1 Tax=Pontiella agarivorans TaxID=3038953 RepID=A0ABU5MT18_9BACT|nr:O-antigen ligase family protein [Pontiella agarivorans]MDZ8117340.1 O-antigen ligase family protein [Pontiella agarivorans]